MNADLTLETQKLARSWDRHEPAWLGDYLVAGVEDPRVNLQSIISRHFLLNALAPARFTSLMRQEYHFAAIMDWLLNTSDLVKDPEARTATLYALRRGADNAEGLEIPAFVTHSFAGLPVEADGWVVPNYVEAFLASAESDSSRSSQKEEVLNTFAAAWLSAIQKCFPVDQPAQNPDDTSTNGTATTRDATRLGLPTLLEPACGSANDFRFLQQYGLARLFNYSGFDLCPKNIENARRLFPNTCFQPGNVFEIAASSRSFDFCIVHDLFEHLSLAGLEQAVQEICRVTCRGMCLGFFQMDEIPQHIVRPHEDYHWNLLSVARLRGLFASHGFQAQVIHLGTFLAHHTGCQQVHNPNAYAFLLHTRD